MKQFNRKLVKTNSPVVIANVTKWSEAISPTLNDEQMGMRVRLLRRWTALSHKSEAVMNGAASNQSPASGSRLCSIAMTGISKTEFARVSAV